MDIKPITSASNPLLKRIRALHQRSAREKSGLFLIEGAKLVNEAHARNVPVRDILVSQSFLKEGLGACHAANISQVAVVEDKLFRELSTTEHPEGIIAVAEIPRHRLSEVVRGKAPLVVVAVSIQDPGNLGTIIRTALAAGASGVVLTKGTVDPYNPKVVRAAAGSLYAMPIVGDLPVDDAIRTLKASGVSVYALDPHADRPYWQTEMSGPVALALGSEGQGLPDAVLLQADCRVRVPMNSACESLNVSVSAGIVLYWAVQQRQQLAAGNENPAK
jgi:TrmH family RNA methyltransferase